MSPLTVSSVIERDAELRIVDAHKGEPVVADEDRRGVIKRLKIADLASNLAEVFTRQLAGEKRLHVLVPVVMQRLGNAVPNFFLSSTKTLRKSSCSTP